MLELQLSEVYIGHLPTSKRKMNSHKVNYIIRVEGHVNSYGLGEEVVPGVALFRAGKYNLTKDELAIAIKSTNIKQGPKQ